MPRPFVAIAAVFALAVALPAADPPAAVPDPAAMAELMAKLGKVGPHHEKLKAMVGKWDCVCVNHEGGQAQSWKATSEFKSLLGGRYVQQEFSGTMPGNIPYSGQGLMGYDNAQEKYVGTWVDSMSTGIMHTTGTYDEATKTTTETGVSHMPFGDMEFKMVTVYRSADEFVFTMSMATPAGDQTMMEITYRRKK